MRGIAGLACLLMVLTPLSGCQIPPPSAVTPT